MFWSDARSSGREGASDMCPDGATPVGNRASMSGGGSQRGRGRTNTEFPTEGTFTPRTPMGGGVCAGSPVSLLCALLGGGSDSLALPAHPLQAAEPEPGEAGEPSSGDLCGRLKEQGLDLNSLCPSEYLSHSILQINRHNTCKELNPGPVT